MTRNPPQRAAMDSAVRYLIGKYTPRATRWLADDGLDPGRSLGPLFFAFVLIFNREQYQPDPLLLGLAAAGTQVVR